MEGIDLAGVVDSDFQGIQINFAPLRPAGFTNFCGAGQDLLFCGAALFPRGGAGWGGAHIPALNSSLLSRQLLSSAFLSATIDFFVSEEGEFVHYFVSKQFVIFTCCKLIQELFKNAELFSEVLADLRLELLELGQLCQSVPVVFFNCHL